MASTEHGPDQGKVPTIKMLIINPNTSQAMTDALKPMVYSLGYNQVEYTFFTCPQGAASVASINSPDDALASTSACESSLLPMLPDYDAFLVACYSQHPLVPWLRAECDKIESSTIFSSSTSTSSDSTITPSSSPTNQRKYVLGILEASITTSLNLLAGSPTPASEKFGIVSTGAIWESALTTGVTEFLHTQNHWLASGGKFLGVETTGLSAVELHDLPADQVRAKMRGATERLARWGCQEPSYQRTLAVVCLGCAGMVGLEGAVRDACVAVMGPVHGRQVRIVDGVKAGVGMLVALCRGAF